MSIVHYRIFSDKSSHKSPTHQLTLYAKPALWAWKTRFRNLRNILADGPDQTDEMYMLDSPVLTNGMYERFLEMVGENQTVIDCTFDVPKPGARRGSALRSTLKRIKKETERAVKSGIENIILSDELQGPERAAAPIILCVGGVHTHLVSKGLRSSCSILVRSAECLDTHYFAVLIGAGATAVNAYLAQDSLSDRVERGLLKLDADAAAQNYKYAIEQGLLKIISKMGISVISSYRGGNNFEALGLSRSMVDEHFPGMTSRIPVLVLPGLKRNFLKTTAKPMMKT